MGKDFFDTLDSLEKVYGDVDDVVEFIQSHRAKYLDLAKSTMESVLRDLRPEDMDSDAWDRRVRAMQRGVLLDALSSNDGFEIHYDGERKVDAVEGLSDELEYDDVLEWVEAGFRGDQEGKDIAAYEGDRTKEQIAMNVYRAISQRGLSNLGKDYTGVRSAIEEYFKSEVNTGLSGFLEVILNAWCNTFLVIVTKDYAEYVERRVMQSL